VALEIERAALHMLSQDAAASDDGNAAQAQRFCDIMIVDLNNREIPIKVRFYNSLREIGRII
jgi:hypothetical protein